MGKVGSFNNFSLGESPRSFYFMHWIEQGIEENLTCDVAPYNLPLSTNARRRSTQWKIEIRFG